MSPGKLTSVSNGENRIVFAKRLSDAVEGVLLRMEMVNELLWKGDTIYQCELCGFSYKDLETAEHCEQYCYSHGSHSPKITRKAIHKPSVQVDPVAA